ncbi:MAG: hypothetical protein GX079_08005, partial [Tissierellia bacterium]|nr:hypothetical protein [Tissierellia bacterium]
EEYLPLLSAAKSQISSRNNKEVDDWSIKIPGSELSSGAIGAIVKAINRGGYTC